MIKKILSSTIQSIIQFAISLAKQPWQVLAFLLIIDFLIATYVVIQVLNFQITTLTSSRIHLKKIQMKQYQIIRAQINKRLNFESKITTQ